MSEPIVVGSEVHAVRGGGTHFKWGSLFDIAFIEGVAHTAAYKPPDTKERFTEDGPVVDMEWPWVRDKDEKNYYYTGSYWWQKDISPEDWEEGEDGIPAPKGPGVFITWAPFPYVGELYVNGVFVTAPEKVLAGFIREADKEDPEDGTEYNLCVICLIGENDHDSQKTFEMFEFLPSSEEDSDPWKSKWSYTTPGSNFSSMLRKVAVNPDATEARFVIGAREQVSGAGTTICEREYIVDIESGSFTVGFDSKNTYPTLNVSTASYAKDNPGASGLQMWGIVNPGSYNHGRGPGAQNNRGVTSEDSPPPGYAPNEIQTYEITRRWIWWWMTEYEGTEEIDWKMTGDGNCAWFGDERRSVDGPLPRPGDILQFFGFPSSNVKFFHVTSVNVTLRRQEGSEGYIGERALVSGYFPEEAFYSKPWLYRCININDSGFLEVDSSSSRTESGGGNVIVDVDYQLDGEVVKLFHAYSKTYSRSSAIKYSVGLGGGGTTTSDWDELTTVSSVFHIEGGKYNGVSIPGFAIHNHVPEYSGSEFTHGLVMGPDRHVFDSLEKGNNLGGYVGYGEVPVTATGRSSTQVWSKLGDRRADFLDLHWYDLRFGYILTEITGYEETYTEQDAGWGPAMVRYSYFSWEELEARWCSFPRNLNHWRTIDNISRTNTWSKSATETFAFTLYRGDEVIAESWGKGSWSTDESRTFNIPVRPAHLNSMHYALNGVADVSNNSFTILVNYNDASPVVFSENSFLYAATDIYGNIVCSVDPNDEWYMSGGNLGYSSFERSDEQCRVILELDPESSDARVTDSNNPASAFDRSGSVFPVHYGTVVPAASVSIGDPPEENEPDTRLSRLPVWKSNPALAVAEYLSEIAGAAFVILASPSEE